MHVLLPTILIGSSLVLTANEVPKLNYLQSCKAAAAVGLIGRDENACKHDEEDARTKLAEEWSSFNTEQRRHCLALSTLGGPSSYVELLTCLEIARDAANLKRAPLEPTKNIENIEE